MATLKEGFEALTTIYNYEQNRMKKEAGKEASGIAKLWSDGNANTVAALISRAYDSGDIMYVSYLMEEIKNQLEKGGN